MEPHTAGCGRRRGLDSRRALVPSASLRLVAFAFLRAAARHNGSFFSFTAANSIRPGGWLRGAIILDAIGARFQIDPSHVAPWLLLAWLSRLRCTVAFFDAKMARCETVTELASGIAMMTLTSPRVRRISGKQIAAECVW